MFKMLLSKVKWEGPIRKIFQIRYDTKVWGLPFSWEKRDSGGNPTTEVRFLCFCFMWDKSYIGPETLPSTDIEEYEQNEQPIMENEDDWWEPCPRCKNFEGYDMCLVKSNFGSVTDETKRRCKENNLFEPKEESK